MSVTAEPIRNQKAFEVTSLKQSFRLLLSTVVGVSDQLDTMIHAIASQLDNKSSSENLIELTSRFKKYHEAVISKKSSHQAECQDRLLSTIKGCLKKSLSPTQLDLLKKLESTIEESNSYEVILESTSDILMAMSVDIEMSREKADKVVGETHSHIQQNGGDVVAADIQQASKRLTREVEGLTSLLSKTYPQDNELSKLLTKASQIKGHGNQFFKALDLLQETNRHISDLIRKERVSSRRLLIEVQTKILTAFEQADGLISHIDAQNGNTSSLKESFASQSSNLKKAAEDADSIESLQSTVNESIDALTETINSYAKEQNKLHLKSKNRITSLSNELQGMQKVVRSIRTQLDNAHEEVLVDELTQVGNRKGYLKHAKKAEDNWRMSGNHTSMIVIDIDHFKSINDNYGHHIGDQVIKKVAALINESVRETDYVARYGGEEFVVICNNTNLEQCAAISEKIRKAISAKKFKIRSTEKLLQISASIGSAEFSAAVTSAKSLFALADKALYKAKNNGRNKTCLFHDNKFKLINR